MQTLAKFKSIPDMKRKVTDSNNYFFSPGAMKFFNSRIESELYQGTFFITSEYMEDPAEKRYTVRYFTEPTEPGTSYDHHDVGEFQEHETLADARTAMMRYAVEQSFIRQVEELLGVSGGLWIATDDNDGSAVLMRDDGESQHAETFGGLTLADSGVRLYGWTDPRDEEVIRVGDSPTPQQFAERVRARVDAYVARHEG